MRELIWYQPCNELSHHLSLVINSLYWEENLPGKIKITDVNKLNSHLHEHHFVQKNESSLMGVVNWHLSERTRWNHVVHPLHSESPAQLDCLHMAFSCSGKGGEEESHAEGIIDITESINEGGVPAIKRSISEATWYDLFSLVLTLKIYTTHISNVSIN